MYFFPVVSNSLFNNVNIQEGTPARLLTSSCNVPLMIASIFSSHLSINEISLLGVLINSAQTGKLSIRIADKSPK